MLLVRHSIVLPEFYSNSISPALNSFWFGLLIVSIVLISAAGYLINDYFDVKADELNKPNKLIVGRHLKRRIVMVTQMVFNVSGLGLGWLCALKVGNAFLFLFHLIAAVLLWYYSVYFKKQAFTGNLIVSILVALVVILVVTFENNAPFNLANNTMWYYGFFYASFAFLVNLIREVVKDAEDMKGDKLIDANTLPIKYGIGFTVKVIILITILTTILVACFSFKEFSKEINTGVSITLSFGCCLPFLLIFIFVRRADTQQAFKSLSNYIKLVMFAGIMSMLFL